MSTQFCAVEVPLWDGYSFFLDGNSKITWDNGTYAEPKPNAFSLPHISTCPGATERCMKSCYVWGLRKHAPETYANYELNARALHFVLRDPAVGWVAVDKLSDWIHDNVASFRWHVSGDVFNESYAHWIVDVCEATPDVKFWIYTRSLWAVRTLTSARNLAVNVSADKDNYAAARRAADTWGARVCYLVSDPGEQLPDLPAGSVIFPDYPLRGRDLPIASEAQWWKSITTEQKRMTCPVDFAGQSEKNRCGPCDRCLYPMKHV